jgi:hypothetical protein
MPNDSIGEELSRHTFTFHLKSAAAPHFRPTFHLKSAAAPWMATYRLW